MAGFPDPIDALMYHNSRLRIPTMSRLGNALPSGDIRPDLAASTVVIEQSTDEVR
jgi:hypothetical protein